MVNVFQCLGFRDRRQPWIFMFLGLLFWWVTHTSQAQAFTCGAQVDKQTVRRGEVVVLTVTAEGDFGWSADFDLPEVAGASLAGGGTNQSVSFVNGKTQSSVSHTYYLTITNHDEVTIGPVTIRAGKEECTTEPVTLTVSSAAGNTSSPATSANRPASSTPQTSVGGGGMEPESGSPGGHIGDDIFVTLKADPLEAYVGQQVILTFSYWRRIQPWNNPTYSPPRSEGFWREDLGQEKNFNRVVGGRNYSVTQVRYALFPTHSGDLTIEPAELRFPGDVFNRFFSSRSRSRGPRILRTDPVVVKVLELPSPRPDGFGGLVAKTLTLRAHVDQDSVQVGDPISYKVDLTADAFLKGFQGLTIPSADGARLHDATESFQTEIKNARLVSHVAVEKILVPQRGGTLEVPPVKLVWFDSDQRSYQVAVATIPPIKVTGQSMSAEAGDTSGFLRAGLTRVGDDLAFIHPVPKHLRYSKKPYVSSVLWWAAMLLPLVLLGIWKFYLDKVAPSGRNPVRLRKKGALRRAQILIKQAKQSEDTLDACTAAARALRGYVADCEGLPRAEMDLSETRNLAEKIGGSSLGDRLMEVLSRCDAIRFGGGDAAESESLVREAEATLNALARERKASLDSKAPLVVSLVVLLSLGSATLLPGTAQAISPPGPDANRLLAEGNQAYTAGDLAPAEKLYLEVQALGVDDPTLYFNLGNTYAREGRLGHAIACYLRARRLAPRDHDVRENLAWVRGNIRDLKLAQDSLPLFIAQISAAIDYFTLDEWSILSLVLVWAFGLLVAWGLAHGYWREKMRRSLTALGAVLIVVAAVTSWRWYQEIQLARGVVVADIAEVRSGPADSFPVLFQVHDGLTVHLVSGQKGWVRISLGGDWTGWLTTDQVEELNPG